MSTVSLEGGTKATYRGTLDASLCARDPHYMLDVFGTLRSERAPRAPQRVTLARNDYFGKDRERLHLDVVGEGKDGLELALWETAVERRPLRDAYQRALKSADDIEVVLRSTTETLLVGSLDLESRRVTLSELTRTPLALKRQSEEGQSCDTHQCHLELSAFELASDLAVLVVVTTGENCSAKCADSAEGQLWTLGPEGFRPGAKLPGTDAMPGGLTYGGRRSRTKLCWTEANGEPPLEILVAHADTDKERTSLSVIGLEPETHSYSRSEEQGDMTREQAEKLCGGVLTEF